MASHSNDAPAFWLTEVQPNAGPKTYQTYQRSQLPESTPQGFRHALLIDFEPAFPPGEPCTLNGMRARLKKFVQSESHQASDVPPVDLVIFLCGDRGGEGKVWRALDGLKPRHLLVKGGTPQDFSFNGLAKLKTKWPLQHLWIASCVSRDYTEFHEVYNSLVSLSLFECDDTGLLPKLPKLQKLAIFEAGACDTFTHLALTRLAHPEKLQVLQVHSSDNLDFEDECQIGDFIHALRRCTSLKTLELYTIYRLDGDDSKGDFQIFAKSLPPSLENLHIRGPSFLLDDSHVEDLRVLMACAVDTEWLPKLQTITFRLDSEHHVQIKSRLPDRATKPLAPEIKMFFAALRLSHPSVKVVEWDRSILGGL